MDKWDEYQMWLQRSAQYHGEDLWFAWLAGYKTHEDASKKRIDDLLTLNTELVEENRRLKSV